MSKKKNDLKTPELIAKQNLENFKDRDHLHKGWIPDRFNEVKNKKNTHSDCINPNSSTFFPLNCQLIITFWIDSRTDPIFPKLREK